MPQQWTDADMEYVVRLREVFKLRWNVIAERLGAKPKVLEVLVCRYRQGHRRRTTTRQKQAAELAINGMTVSDIATQLGTSIASVRDALRREGIDAEALRAIAQGRDPFA